MKCKQFSSFRKERSSKGKVYLEIPPLTPEVARESRSLYSATVLIHQHVHHLTIEILDFPDTVPVEVII